MSYLDTSIVVAYYVPEPLSPRAQAAITREAAPAISELVELEFFSATLHLAIAGAEGLPLLTADQQLARAAEHLGLEFELIRGA